MSPSETMLTLLLGVVYVYMHINTVAGKDYRSDKRCGSKYVLSNGKPAQCNPDSGKPCCSASGWCGVTDAHCKCNTCIDYRNETRYTEISFVDAKQSSTETRYSCTTECKKCIAKNAIDDDLSSNAYTNVDTTGWWMGKLKNSIQIHEIHLYLSEYQYRVGYLKKLKVETIMNSNSNWIVCQEEFSVEDPIKTHDALVVKYIVKCQQETVARSIRISTGMADGLGLIEVKVFGTASAPTTTSTKDATEASTKAPVATPCLSWYCVSKLNNGGVRIKTLHLETAQNALGIGRWDHPQAIIPMTGHTAGDPHILSKSWRGGSMWWLNWHDIRKMQVQCENAGLPIVCPTFHVGTAVARTSVYVGELQGEACANACKERRKTDPTIIGAMYNFTSWCSCYREVTSVNEDKRSYMSCFFDPIGYKLSSTAPPPTTPESWVSRPGPNNCGTDYKTGEYTLTSDDILLPDGRSYKTCTRQKGWWTVKCGTKYIVKCRPSVMISNYASDGSKCECELKPVKKPSFVPTGLIQWKGTTKYSIEFFSGDKEAEEDNIEGIMYKDDKGLFILNQTFYNVNYYREHREETWHKVRILVPDGKGKFTKITRSNVRRYNNKLKKVVPTDNGCRITNNVESSESLDQLWDLTKQGFPISFEHWNLLEDGEKVQKWGGKLSKGPQSSLSFNYHRMNWKFTVEKRGDFVVPKKFYKWMTHAGPTGTININYTYDKTVSETMDKSVEDFKNEYCKEGLL